MCPKFDYTKSTYDDEYSVPPNRPASSLVRYDVSLLTPEDFYLFNEGSHYRIYEKLGAHL